MDFKFLWSRTKFLVLDPEKAWQTIYAENRPYRFVRGSFFFPLIIAVAVSAFFGSLLFTNTGVSGVYSVLAGIKYFLIFYIVIYATALIFNKITKTLDLKSDFLTSFKIIVYSATPFLLCQIISRLFESFIFINVLALYGLYIFWIGNERMLDPPENKKTPMLLGVAVLFITLFLLTSWMLTLLSDKVYFTFFS